MKFRIALASLCAVGVTSSLMSMENEKPCLNFIMDNNICITGYSKHNMNFAKKPSDFIGKNIIDVLPLDDKSRNAISLGFFRAVDKKETVKVPYELKNAETSEIENFVAKITALKTKDEFYNYFIKVQEAKK